MKDLEIDVGKIAKINDLKLEEFVEALRNYFGFDRTFIRNKIF